jgi:hypothetical protein
VENGSSSTLQRPYAAIGIQRDNKSLTKLCCLFQEKKMTGMKQIKAAVCQRNAVPLRPPTFPQPANFIEWE